MSNLKNKAISGARWSAVENISIQGIRFVINIILARLLIPSDYGITGLIAIFLSISDVFVNGGFYGALIQKKNRTDVDYSTVFYFNIVVSVLCWIALFFSRNLIANFFHEPKLISITPVLGLIIIINGFSLVQRVKLTCEINFKSQAKISFVSAILAGLIGIYFAYKGFGVWALVIQSIARGTLNCIGLWISAKWLPKFIFSKKSFKELFSFGSKMLISGLLNTVFMNIYNLIIGRFFSTADLGYYSRAKQFNTLPSQNIMGVMAKVSFPTMSLVQDDDKKLINIFRKFLQLALYVTMPLMVGMLILSEPLIITLLTDKWMPSIIYLQLLSVGGITYPIHVLNLKVLEVKGRSDLFLKLEIIKKMFVTLSIACTFWLNIKALLIGSIVTSIIGLYINTYYIKKIINYGLVKQLKDIIHIVYLVIAMGICVYLTKIMISSYLYQLIIGTFVGMFVYFTLSYYFKYKELSYVFQLLKIRKKNVE